jgi:polygalacturonase
MVNVKDYGAKGDNTTDDTAAIQKAIKAAETVDDGQVYFPPGDYVVSSTLEGTR